MNQEGFSALEIASKNKLTAFSEVASVSDLSMIMKSNIFSIYIILHVLITVIVYIFVLSRSETVVFYMFFAFLTLLVTTLTVVKLSKQKTYKKSKMSLQVVL